MSLPGAIPSALSFGHQLRRHGGDRAACRARQVRFCFPGRHRRRQSRGQRRSARPHGQGREVRADDDPVGAGAVTKHLGFVATSTTTFNEPYTLARQFASLDQISGGRSAWNLVTSNNEQDALNYSRTEHMAHADRYERAIEFAEVVLGLWDSWDEDAFIRDKESGVFYDTDEDACAEPQGKALPGARAAQRRALAAGPARCWCRPAPRAPAATSLRASRRSSSPRRPSSSRARNSTPT